MCFYNVGIQNKEVPGRNSHAKCRKLQGDIEKIFDPNRGVQALFLFIGQMRVRGYTPCT